MTEQDVPSPINWQSPSDVAEWERTAQTRPGRAEMFESFGHELRALGNANANVLELGSGPGFLAAFLLDALPRLRLTLVDFSAPMHDLARARLGTTGSAGDISAAQLQGPRLATGPRAV